MNLIKLVIVVLVILLLSGSKLFANDLDDPRMRDEDLSHTIVTSSYRILADGMYEYLYDIESPLTNKGQMLVFRLDISCNISIPPVTFTEKSAIDFYNKSLDGNHIPVVADGIMHITSTIGITEYNHLKWGIGLRPGEKAKGHRVVSPIPPGKIRYTIVPNMTAEGWDYKSFTGDDPSVPRKEDFTITGMITGPACPNRNEAFPGTNKHRKESYEINNLLTYSNPLKNSFHVEEDTQYFNLAIHYADDIDSKTFKTKPGNLRKLFNPKPGATEIVSLPIHNRGKKNKRNKIMLEVRKVDVTRKYDIKTNRSGPETKNSKGNNKRLSGHNKDVDVFHIIVDGRK